MNEEALAVMIPIIALLVIGFIFFGFLAYRQKAAGKVQETIQAAIDKGVELTPELIEKLTGPAPRGDRDLRRGLISVFLGFATAIFGQFIPDDDEASMIFLGIATFPFLVGVAYLIMWRITSSGEQR